jgi:DNA ligase-1
MTQPNNEKTVSAWLYKRDTKGKIRKWRYCVQGDKFWSEQGVDEPDAKLTVNKPTIAKPKNVGKANETSGAAQAEKEAQAKFDKKLKEGYFVDRDKVDNAFQEPMRAQDYFKRHEKGKTKFPMGCELKLNGVRCTYRSDGKLISRTNHEFHTIPHILRSVEKYFPKGIFLDGEIFNEAMRENLNQLAQVVNVTHVDPTPEELEKSLKIARFYIYDAFNFKDPDTGKKITADTPQSERRHAFFCLVDSILRNINLRNEHPLTKIPFIETVQYRTVHRHADVLDRLDEAVEDKHEGVILRVLDGKYEFKRSYNLLKVKKFYDDEFEIEEIQEGKGNWAGYAKRIICKLKPEHIQIAKAKDKDHTNFASNIEGDQEYLKRLWEERDQHVGKMATVRYQCISEYGVPQIPWIETIRDYE